MEVKSTEWRPGPTVCRCCLSEGCYKDISTEYFWMGKREVYAEMLSETFDVTIAFSKSGGPNSNSRLICEPCISRLRDASEFKRQVLECEKTFMQHLDPGTSTSTDLDISVDTEKEVKLERIKTEKRLSDDDFDDHGGFDDDDDDLDDEPLTKLASKVPKKESVDLLDLLDNAKVAEKRKSTTKTKSTPAKKSKKETIQPTPSKTVKIEKKKKDNDPMIMARRNATILVQYTTAYPFRLPEDKMVCVYCADSFGDPAAYRKHMGDEHVDFNPKSAFWHISEGYVKTDCTELKCRICSEPFDDLDSIAKHLHYKHDQKICLNADLGLQPFKIHKDKMNCALCNVKSTCLRQLSRHTLSHFLKFTCEACGKSYPTCTSLRHHIRFSHAGVDRICRKCKMSFTSLIAKREHLQTSKNCWPYLCTVCGERFMSWTLKQSHKNEVHGAAKKSFACTVCGQIFENRKKYRTHFVISHTDDSFTCPCCGVKYDSKRALEEHRVVHTKEKLFPCTVCSKSFPRKKNLVQHMWIHNEHKRFECTLCNKQFNQRVSWKSHMKSYHPGLIDFVSGAKNNNSKFCVYPVTN